jgi:hypothetical protein
VAGRGGEFHTVAPEEAGAQPPAMLGFCSRFDLPEYAYSTTIISKAALMSARWPDWGCVTVFSPGATGGLL